MGNFALRRNGSLLRGTQPILPVTPDKPDRAHHQDSADHGIEFVEVLAEFAPVFAELHTEICESQAPGPGSEESIEVKTGARHAGDAGGERDERSDNGQQAADEDGEVSPAPEEAV